MNHPKTEAEIRTWMLEHLASMLQVKKETVDAAGSFIRLGVDSLTAVEISMDLESFVGRELSPSVLYEYRNVEALSKALATPEDENLARKPVSLREFLVTA